jgi:hypothetical protein
MSDRFRLLERDKLETRDEKSSETAPEPRLQRALEHGEELALDSSGRPRTHFCRSCEAETVSGTTQCFNCGGEIGGPGQDTFDAVKRRELSAEHDAQEREARRARAVEEARALAEKQRAVEAESESLRSSAAPRPQLPPLPVRLQLGVILVCLFATLSATLHLFLSAVYAEVPWSVLAEVMMAAIATWVVFTIIQARHR